MDSNDESSEKNEVFYLANGEIDDVTTRFHERLNLCLKEESLSGLLNLYQDLYGNLNINSVGIRNSQPAREIVAKSIRAMLAGTSEPIDERKTGIQSEDLPPNVYI